MATPTLLKPYLPYSSMYLIEKMESFYKNIHVNELPELKAPQFA